MIAVDFIIQALYGVFFDSVAIAVASILIVIFAGESYRFFLPESLEVT